MCDDDDDCDWQNTDLEVTISIKHIIMLLIMQMKTMCTLRNIYLLTLKKRER